MGMYGERALQLSSTAKKRRVSLPDNIIDLPSIVVVEKIENLPARPVYAFVKRTFDIVAALIGAILALVPMLFIALAVRLDSKGTVFFTQERLGKDGKPFQLYKFRSMRVDAEKNGAQWAAKNDDRVTRVGRFLRKTRLDELPQLWNILAGEMSFVGPRPEREVFYEEFEKHIRGFKQRLMVKPGLTGWAQVNGGYDLGPEEKIVYDVEYIKNASIRLDLKCILKTVAIVFSHDGAR